MRVKLTEKAVEEGWKAKIHTKNYTLICGRKGCELQYGEIYVSRMVGEVVRTRRVRCLECAEKEGLILTL